MIKTTEVFRTGLSGADIRRLRGVLTQAEFASRVGVTVSTVARWEADMTRPSPLAMRRLARLAKPAQPKIDKDSAASQDFNDSKSERGAENSSAAKQFPD